MAVFNDVLTTDGEALIAKMLSGQCEIVFTRMEWGDGRLSDGEDERNIKALKHKVTESSNITVSRDNQIVYVSGEFTNQELSDGMYLREKGIFASDGTKEVLMVYANNGSLAEYIAPAIEELIEKTMRSIMTFNQGDKINIQIKSEVFTYKDDFEKHLNDKNNPHTIEFEEAKDLEELVSEENMSLSFGKIAKAVSSLISHLDENDSKNYIVTFDSGDTANPTAWKNVATLTSKEKHSSLFSKISTMFNNVRYLYKILGTTDISTLGTVTQAISTIKGNIGDMKGISSSAAITTQGQYALDAREKNASVEGTLANELSKVNSNLNQYPAGFNARTTASNWGNTIGTHVTGWDIGGCEVAFLRDNPNSGKLSMKIDGYFYQNEGQYRVLDTTDYDALKSNFQAGVDSIYNAIVAQGTTPSSKSLSDVTSGIINLSNNRYNNGYSNGVSDADNRSAPGTVNFASGGENAISMFMSATNSFNSHMSSNTSYRSTTRYVNVGYSSSFQSIFGNWTGSMKNGTLDGTVSYSGYAWSGGNVGSWNIVKWGGSLGAGCFKAVSKGIATVTCTANLGGTYTMHVIFFVVY